jgi:predicted PurR-regulated permease PerM
VLRPFVSALLWAIILVYCTWPAFRFLTDRVRLKPGAAHWSWCCWNSPWSCCRSSWRRRPGARTSRTFRGLIERGIVSGPPEVGRLLERLPLVGARLAEWWNAVAFDMTGVLETIQPYAGTIAQSALSVLLALLSGLAEVIVAILLAFFFYRDGPAIAATAQMLLRRLAGERADRLWDLTANVTTGVVYGLMGTAVAQGFLTALGLWISGVPRPCSWRDRRRHLHPAVGAPVVWIPASIWLFATGQTGWGIFLALYGAIGISSVDNVIRPWLIARGADLPLLLTILGALGGVFAFGFLGLFLGPVLLALGYSLLKDWASKRDEPAL